MVELQAVTVRFGPRLALRELSLKVPVGGSLALWGPNGAGKSTTFNAILNLVPYAGQILIDGRNAAREGASVRRLIGWAPQDLAPADLTVARTVAFMADVREAKVPSVAEYLAPFGLADAVGQTVAALSGGQRKRLSLALALLNDPAVLLLDEPTANLDPQGRQEMIRLLLGLRRQGKTLIMASHRLGDVIRLCDEVAMLSDGCLRQLVGAPALVRRRLARRAGGPVRRLSAPGKGGGQACASCD